MRDREVKIKREIEELFLKPVILSIDDMSNLEEKEMKIRPIKSNWYDLLINFIRGPIIKRIV